MTRIVETKIFKYDELSESAQEKARDWYTRDGLDYEWWDSVYDDFERICNILGVNLSTDNVKLMNGSFRKAPRIYFNGFCHAGGGSSFEGNYEYKKGAHNTIREYAPMDETLHDVADSLLAIQKANMYRVTASISNSGRYYSLSVDSYLTDHINGGSDCGGATLDDDVKDAFDTLNGWLYSMLERVYEYLMSDDVVSESIIANEYEFTEDGNIA